MSERTVSFALRKDKILGNGNQGEFNGEKSTRKEIGKEREEGETFEDINGLFLTKVPELDGAIEGRCKKQLRQIIRPGTNTARR